MFWWIKHQTRSQSCSTACFATVLSHNVKKNHFTLCCYKTCAIPKHMPSVWRQPWGEPTEQPWLPSNRLQLKGHISEHKTAYEVLQGYPVHAQKGEKDQVSINISKPTQCHTFCKDRYYLPLNSACKDLRSACQYTTTEKPPFVLRKSVKTSLLEIRPRILNGDYWKIEVLLVPKLQVYVYACTHLCALSEIGCTATKFSDPKGAQLHISPY